ncbi:hypothetical protein H5410_037519 [Solanum commersonii]|uniref:Uncharacterized protein n=1 Tax=Solanum commersonii TaxID=4109 RepID=A0A9J5Y8P2_SOLCO|nr:hypothetical protein H5410_037519 [Solanum commersonii]
MHELVDPNIEIPDNFYKAKKLGNVANKNQDVSPEVESNEWLIPQELSTTEASDDNVEVMPEDILLRPS